MLNHCIICYKGLGVPDPAKKNENDISSKSREKCDMFFKLLGRYLKEPGGDDCFQPFQAWEKIFDVGIPISCGACQGVMNSFCELFHQMKSIELLINWKLWTLKNIMHSAQRVPSRLNDFKEAIVQMTVGNGSGVEKLNLIFNIKRDIIKKCRRKLLTTFPKLQLVKFQEKMDESVQVPAAVEDRINIPDVGITSDSSSITVPVQVTGNNNIPLNRSQMTLETDDTSAMDHEAEEQVVASAHTESASFTSVAKQLSKASEGRSKRKKRSKLLRLQNGARLKMLRKGALARCRVTKLLQANTTREESEAPSPNAEENLFSCNDYIPESPERCAIAEMEADDIEVSSIHPTKDLITTGQPDRNGGPEAMDNSARESIIPDIHVDVLQMNETSNVISTPTQSPPPSPSRNSIDGEELPQPTNTVTSKNLKTEITTNNSSDPEVVSSIDFTTETNFEEVPSFFNLTPASTRDVAATTEPGMELEDPVLTTLTEARETEESSECRLRAVHRCVNCMKSFSVLERLLQHQQSHWKEECSDAKSTDDDRSLSEVENSESDFGCSADEDEEDESESEYDGNLICTNERVSVETKTISAISIPCEMKKTYLNHHLSEHLGLPPLKKTQSCDICKTTFFGGSPTILKISLRRHYKKHHDIQNIADGDVHKCDLEDCPAYFLTLRQLLTHKAKVHQIAPQYDCSDCRSNFKYASSLRRHISGVHKRGAPSSLTFSPNPGDILHDSESDDSEAEYYNDDDINVVNEDSDQEKHGEDLVLQPPPQSTSTLDPNSETGIVDNITIENTHAEGNSTLEYEKSTEPLPPKEAVGEERIEYNQTEVNKLEREAESAESSNDLIPPGLTNKASVRSIPLSESMPEIKREPTEPHGRTTRSSNRTLVTKREKTSNTNFISLEAPIARRRGRRQVFQCKIKNCEKKLANKEDYENHQKLHGKFTCFFCDVTKDHALELAKHEITEHSQIAEKEECPDDKGLKTESVFFTCPRPSCTYRRKYKECISHFVSNHLGLDPITNGQQTCNICKSIVRGDHMKDHYNANHNIKKLTGSDVKKCEQARCPAYFLTFLQLRKHEKKVHAIEKRYTCTDCNLTFSCGRHLRQHDRTKHKDQLNYVCSFQNCGNQFKTKEWLDNHLQLTHKRLQLIKCPKCEKQCWGIHTLRQHVKSHSFVRKAPVKKPAQVFQCKVPDCGDKLTSKKEYENHQKLHGKFTCSFCDVTKDYAPELAKHEITEHSQIAEKEECSDGEGFKNGSTLFTCPRPNCSVRSSNEQECIDHVMLKHMELHQIVKKGRTCTICKLTICRAYPMKTHYNVNHNLKNLTGSAIKKCVQTGCAAYFLTSRQLGLHERNVHGIDKRSTCVDCNITFKNGTGLRQHDRQKHKDELNYVCTFEDCDKRFKTNELLDSHFEVVHERFRCRVKNCNDKLTSKKEYENHQKLHGKFTCFFCDVTKGYAPELAKHEIREHSQIAENVQCSDDKGLKNGSICFTCPRPKCLVRSSNEQEYIHHFVTEHMKLNPIKKWQTCTICKLTLSRRSNMTQHYNGHHNLKNLRGSDAIKCGQTGCAAYFLTLVQLRTHERKVHAIQERYSCADCNKSFKRRNTWREHYRQKHGHELNYVCIFENCDNRFKTNELLEGHIKAVHEQKLQLLKCPTCERGCWGQVRLMQHLKLHSPNHNAHGKYICELCGKACRDNVRLEVHHLAHSGPASWKFECSICSKKCLTQQKLDEHMRTHTKEKPFVCEICGEKYAHRHNLRNHVNSKHGNVAHDKPRKFNTANLTSRKGIKRKKVEEETFSESSSDSDN